MSLQELIYTSVSCTASSDEAVKDILDTSERNNMETSVTGLLMFDGQRYIQILEGTPQDVDNLYEKISQDMRHDQLELLHKGVITERSFENWRMAYEDLPLGLLETLAENMAVFSMELDGKALKAGESFGANLNGMFMNAVTVE